MNLKKYLFVVILIVLSINQVLSQNSNVLSRKSTEIEKLESVIVKSAGYLDKGDYYRAIEGLKESIELSKNINSGFHFGFSIKLLAQCHFGLGNYTQALEYNKIALSTFEYNAKDSIYRSVLINISDCYNKLGEYDKALLVMQDYFSLLKNQYGEYMDKDKYNSEYYPSLLSLSSCYYYLGDYYKSIMILEELSEYEVKRNSGISETYAYTLENISMDYLRLGRLRDALYYEENALDIIVKLYGYNDIRCAKMMYYLGHLYNVLGNNEKARELIKKSIRIIKNEMGEFNIDHISALRALSLTYADLKKRIETLEEIQGILREGNINDYESYVYTYRNLANTYAELGEKEMFYDIEQRVHFNKKIQDYFQKNKRAYADYMQSIFDSYLKLGDYSKAINVGKQTWDIYKILYGDDITSYSTFILELFICYVKLKDYVNAVKIIKDNNVFNKIKEDLLSSIDLLPYCHRVNYWNSSLRNVFCNFLPLLAYSGEEDYFITQAYDNSALFAKGFMLNTEMNMSNMIDNHGDKMLKELYYSYLLNRSKVVRAYDKHVKDSLSTLITNQEDQIWQTLKKQHLTKTTNVTWKDIQKRLTKYDVAIEFLSFFDDNFKQYNVALLLKKDYVLPKIVALGDFQKMKQYSISNKNDSLYELVWQPMEKELKDIKNIYFSPAGQIYNCPIEYLVDKNGTYMCDKYNIYRLSSTKMILAPAAKRNYKKSVLYGGLDYNYDTIPTFQKNCDVEDIYFPPIERGLLDSLSNRSGFESLPNTSIEISEISKLLSYSNVDCITYMGMNGLEESFKKLSGSLLDIIHLSTHGMYIENSADSVYLNNKNLKFVDETLYISPEDAALARSFLVMSRGNMLPQHYKIPHGVDDGILTAQEISNIDLKNVDLVVLSACQTALGDIDYDGVYGLQRGFKKAGANTILMSLDKVDDEATRILMVEFYRNLMFGKSKHQSLKDAQEYLRHVENKKYDKPEYWASFIMLDGLD